MAKKGSDKEMQILEAAARVFEQKGFSGATTREIAHEAGVAEGTIFNYFPSKKDILHQILLKVVNTLIPELTIRSLEQTFMESKGKSPDEVLSFVLQNRLQFIRKNFALLKILLLDVRYHDDLKEIYNTRVYLSVRKMIEQNISEAIEAGIFRPIDVSTAATCFMGIFFGMLMFEPDLVAGEEADQDIAKEKIDQIVDIIFYGARKVNE